jgi:hypothetical protein
MRPIILATLALGILGAPALARSPRAVDTHQRAYHRAPSAVAGRASGITTAGITIGNPGADRDAVLALLDERGFRQSNGTMAGEQGGASGLGGSAGGVGAR